MFEINFVEKRCVIIYFDNDLEDHHFEVTPATHDIIRAHAEFIMNEYGMSKATICDEETGDIIFTLKESS